MSTHHSLVVASLVMAFGPLTVQGQEQTIETKKQLAAMLNPAAFAHPHTSQPVATVLRTNGQYTTFLTLVERAGLLPLLQGTVHDTTYAAVTFAESADSTKNPPAGAAQVNISGAVPPGVDLTAVKERALEMLDSAINEAQKYALAQDSLLTVFAPTNAAFAKLSKVQLDALMHDSTALVAFVRAHIVTKGVYTQSLPKIRSLQSLAGSLLPVGKTAAGTSTVGGIALIGPELVAANGVAHGLAAVLPWPTTPALTIPQTPASVPAAPEGLP